MCEVEHILENLNVEDGGPPAKRSTPSIRLEAGFKWNLQALANAANAVESGGKSPVSALNELGVRVGYTLLRQGGPAHCPSFTVCVNVADLTFEGWGHSKREARASAARACLNALLARAGRVLTPKNAVTDFTSDNHDRYTDMQSPETQAKPLPSLVTTLGKMELDSPVSSASTQSPSAALFGVTTAPAPHKSPINILYENYPGLTFLCTYGDGSSLDVTQAPLQLSHSMRFKVVCQIKEHKFEGYGSSKKLAKLAAARSALAVLEEGSAPTTNVTSQSAGFLPQTLADHIAQLVNEKFNEVMKNDVVHSKRKVLAGIVITIDNKIEGARVIAVTTGTKCVSGEHISVRGRAVNDCHAEVAARRCLQRHIYAQLLMYAQSADPRSLIEHSDLEPLATGGYRLKPSRGLHLYVSTAPCGDARIFSPHEHDLSVDRHPNRLARGQLRTKIESGEGTIPVKNCNNVVQTWDGVMQGERLLTMSCSDKVARWSCVGLQGALLSRLVRPVVLDSVVLGSLLHPHHMYRAICGRIEKHISCLPPPFSINRPLLARAASTEARTPARAPSFSVCWSCTSPQPEIINATTGKLESGQPSLLCKQSMFARWLYLVARLPLIQDVDSGIEQPPLPRLDNLLYNEAKQLCPAYQAAKSRLIEAFDKAKLGRWIKKPLEQDQFVCEIVDPDPQVLFAWAGHSLPAYSTVQPLSQAEESPRVPNCDDTLKTGEIKASKVKIGDNISKVNDAKAKSANGDTVKLNNKVADVDNTGKFDDNGNSVKEIANGLSKVFKFDDVKANKVSKISNDDGEIKSNNESLNNTNSRIQNGENASKVNGINDTTNPKYGTKFVDIVDTTENSVGAPEKFNKAQISSEVPRNFYNISVKFHSNKHMKRNNNCTLSNNCGDENNVDAIDCGNVILNNGILNNMSNQNGQINNNISSFYPTTNNGNVIDDRTNLNTDMPIILVNNRNNSFNDVRKIQVKEITATDRVSVNNNSIENPNTRIRVLNYQKNRFTKNDSNKPIFNININGNNNTESDKENNNIPGGSLENDSKLKCNNNYGQLKHPLLLRKLEIYNKINLKKAE